MSRDTAYLSHIMDAIAKIETYVAVGYDEFMGESHWQDSVIRQLEIIGEATKQLSDNIRAKHPEIPWRKMAGLRDVLIHNYMGVDLSTVWELTQKDLPKVKKLISKLIV